MVVLALAKTKGGVGSTTLAACLAVEASQRGKRVGILDCDPQRSLERWWQARQGEAQLGLNDRKLELVEHQRHLDDTLDQAKSANFDVLIIDGPPGNVDTTAMIIDASDFILIASQPSPLDVGAMDAVVDLARESGKPYAFVLTRTRANAVATPQARAFLETLGEVLVVPGSKNDTLEIMDRVGYPAAMLRGATLPEIEPAKGKALASAEIAALWDAVEARLRKVGKATKTRVAS